MGAIECVVHDQILNVHDPISKDMPVSAFGTLDLMTNGCAAVTLIVSPVKTSSCKMASLAKWFRESIYSSMSFMPFLPLSRAAALLMRVSRSEALQRSKHSV